MTVSLVGAYARGRVPSIVRLDDRQPSWVFSQDRISGVTGWVDGA